VGISSAERLDEVLGLRGKRLSPEEKFLEEMYQPRKVDGHAWGFRGPSRSVREEPECNVARTGLDFSSEVRGQSTAVNLSQTNNCRNQPRKVEQDRTDRQWKLSLLGGSMGV
jgi:hypothetical protein